MNTRNLMLCKSSNIIIKMYCVYRGVRGKLSCELLSSIKLIDNNLKYKLEIIQKKGINGFVSIIVILLNKLTYYNKIIIQYYFQYFLPDKTNVSL